MAKMGCWPLSSLYLYKPWRNTGFRQLLCACPTGPLIASVFVICFPDVADVICILVFITRVYWDQLHKWQEHFMEIVLRWYRVSRHGKAWTFRQPTQICIRLRRTVSTIVAERSKTTRVLFFATCVLRLRPKMNPCQSGLECCSSLTIIDRGWARFQVC